MSMSKFNEKAFLILFVLIGLIIRYLPFFNELKESPILFYQPDNLYYVRRVMTILNDFPKVPRFDYYLNFAEAVDFPSPPFYPFFLAFVSWIISLGKANLHIVELVTSGVTAISGSLICIPVYLISKKIMSNKYALMVSFISVFMPLHYWYTNAIDGDHHALESLMALFLFNSFMDVYKENNFKDITKFVLCLLIIFLLWQGAILYAGIIVLYVFGYTLLYSRDYKTSRYLGFSIVFLRKYLLKFCIPPIQLVKDRKT